MENLKVYKEVYFNFLKLSEIKENFDTGDSILKIKVCGINKSCCSVIVESKWF